MDADTKALKKRKNKMCRHYAELKTKYLAVNKVLMADMYGVVDKLDAWRDELVDGTK